MDAEPFEPLNLNADNRSFKDMVSTKSSSQMGIEFENSCNECIDFFSPEYILQMGKQIDTTDLDLHFSSKFDITEHFEEILLGKIYNCEPPTNPPFEVLYNDYLFKEEISKKPIIEEFKANNNDTSLCYIGEIKSYSGDIKDKQIEELKAEDPKKIDSTDVEKKKKKKAKKKSRITEKMTIQIVTNLIAYQKQYDRVPNYFICISNGNRDRLTAQKVNGRILKIKDEIKKKDKENLIQDSQVKLFWVYVNFKILFEVAKQRNCFISKQKHIWSLLINYSMNEKDNLMTEKEIFMIEKDNLMTEEKELMVEKDNLKNELIEEKDKLTSEKLKVDLMKKIQEINVKIDKIEEKLKTKINQISQQGVKIKELEIILNNIKEKSKDLYSSIEFAQLLKKELNESKINFLIKNFEDSKKDGITFEDLQKICEMVDRLNSIFK